VAAPDVLQTLGEPAHVQKRRCQVAADLGVVRVERDCSPEALDRGIALTRSLEQHREIEVERGNLRRRARGRP